MDQKQDEATRFELLKEERDMLMREMRNNGGNDSGTNSPELLQKISSLQQEKEQMKTDFAAQLAAEKEIVKEKAKAILKKKQAEMEERTVGQIEEAKNQAALDERERLKNQMLEKMKAKLDAEREKMEAEKQQIREDVRKQVLAEKETSKGSNAADAAAANAEQMKLAVEAEKKKFEEQLAAEKANLESDLQEKMKSQLENELNAQKMKLEAEREAMAKEIQEEKKKFFEEQAEAAQKAVSSPL